MEYPTGLCSQIAPRVPIVSVPQTEILAQSTENGRNRFENHARCPLLCSTGPIRPPDATGRQVLSSLPAGTCEPRHIHARTTPSLVSKLQVLCSHIPLVLSFPLPSSLIHSSRQNMVSGFCFAASAWPAMNARLLAAISSNVTGSKSLTSTPALNIRERRAMSGQ